METEFAKALKPIQMATNILVVTHPKPDGDALGSTKAVKRYLDRINKPYRLFCSTPIPEDFTFLIDPESFNGPADLNFGNFDLIISLDCGDSRRTGLPQDILDKKRKILNFDHHISNDFFGQVNIVNPTASSTCEILYEFFKYHEIKFDIEMAEALLTGFITDTGNFTNAATNLKVVNYTSELLLSGVNLKKVHEHILKNKSLLSLQFWGEILSRLEENKKYGVAYTIVTQNDFQKFNLTPEIIEGIANFLNSLEGYNFIMLLRQEEDGLIKGSFRTQNKNINVAELAACLGGGGHPQAAGFGLAGNLSDKNGSWQIE